MPQNRIWIGPFGGGGVAEYLDSSFFKGKFG